MEGFFWDPVNSAALESCGNNDVGPGFSSESHFPEEPSFSTCQTRHSSDQQQLL